MASPIRRLPDIAIASESTTLEVRPKPRTTTAHKRTPSPSIWPGQCPFSAPHLFERRLPPTPQAEASTQASSCKKFPGRGLCNPMCSPTRSRSPDRSLLDLLHAIHGMPPRTPLLQSVGAAQSQITTARVEPPWSLAVPYSMPQRSPNPSKMTPTSRGCRRPRQHAETPYEARVDLER
jgi:hypothetical protein